MEGDGPFGADEHDGETGDERDGPDLPFRGWVPPDDRLWLHPSEGAGGVRGRTPAGIGGARDAGAGARHPYAARRHPLVTVGVAAVAVLSTVAAGFALADVPKPSSTGAFMATDTSVSSPLPSSSGAAASLPRLAVGMNVVELANAVRSSLVEVTLRRGSDPMVATGVALPGGTLVMVAAVALLGVTSVGTVTLSGRRENATMLAADPRAGVGVIRLPGRLPSPRLSLTGDMMPGQLAVSVCLRNATIRGRRVLRPPEPVVSVGMIRSVGTSLDLAGGPALIDTIAADAPTPGCEFGGVLLDSSGAVAGILAWQQKAGEDLVDYFTPSSLAVGAASQLASARRVVHGWLGIVGATGPRGVGALVERVLAGSAASKAGLVPGDVVESIDGQPVTSMADLQARLYVMPPGSSVSLVVDQGGQQRTVRAVLAARPG